MVTIMSEKEFQHYIMDYLKEHNWYIIRKDSNYDRLYAMDKEILLKFLRDTQPDEIIALEKVYKADFEQTFINFLNLEIEKKGILNILKYWVEISNIKLELMYRKPETSFNPEQVKKYNQNIFSVAEEVWASSDERIDLVIFLNWLAIMSFELKCNNLWQSYEDAIYQYRMERDPNTRLFHFKSWVLINFAMDLEQVYMASKLSWESTFFLPFNMWNWVWVNAWAWNPMFMDDFSTSYMWKDVLTKDSIVELISKFIFVEVKEEEDEITWKKKKKETQIFPRYHQRDAIHKILADVHDNWSSQNYLIQHSAWSWKTKSIAWLAYRLSTYHDDNDKIIFNNVIIVTDRVVVDRQLQDAIKQMDHKDWFIKVMDEDCNSHDLKMALESNTKIIATTIQKFPYIADEVANLKDKKFAVIIDEAHSSTAWKNMAAVTKTLSSWDWSDDDWIEELIVWEIRKHWKQNNVSMFAFTATPKPTTLQLFGRVNKDWYNEAFHIYSMKQAIEEWFILDVLQNYITYETYYQLNKAIQDDPKCKTSFAKKQIARFIELHDTNIAQRIEVIVEHFRTTVMNELGWEAKAMVITPSREAAVKYYQAFVKYIEDKWYNMHALVAFSWTVKIWEKEYTESWMNWISEKLLPQVFDKSDFQVLLVADKYQTWFDQKKLSAMYVAKKLKGINAVQTLSRLNRIYPPYDKHTFILDFVNTYKDIEDAFSKYYTTTLLSSTVNQQSIKDLSIKIDWYNIIDPMSIDIVSEITYSWKIITPKDSQLIDFHLKRTKADIERLPSDEDDNQQKEFIILLRKFVRFYEFLIQATCYEDAELHKKYEYILLLLKYISIKHPWGWFDLKGKIKAMNFVQKRTWEHKKSNLKSDPIVKLPTADSFSLNEEQEKRLSEIIDEINSRTWKNYNNDVAVKAMLQIKDLMMESKDLKNKATANKFKDFELAYYSNIDDILIEWLSQNQDFFSLLLNNDDIKVKVLWIFAKEIYYKLNDKKE